MSETLSDISLAPNSTQELNQTVNRHGFNRHLRVI